jgi:hypothetical protein
MKICLEQLPEEIDINEGHKAACWLNIKSMVTAGKEAFDLKNTSPNKAPKLLEVKNLSNTFR